MRNSELVARLDQLGVEVGSAHDLAVAGPHVTFLQQLVVALAMSRIDFERVFVLDHRFVGLAARGKAFGFLQETVALGLRANADLKIISRAAADYDQSQCRDNQFFHQDFLRIMRFIG